jgi:Coenzyme PQQ synthesis protein D (PqqD)
VAQLSEASGNGVAVDARRVVHETIDGEVILIQLETGFYYSLDGVGAEIWALLSEDTAPTEIANRLSERHGTDPAAATAVVNQLLRELCDESLVVGSPPVNGTLPPGALEGIAAPELRKYTDMEDFLLVDPVHDVDDTGWPNLKAAG